MSSWMLGSNWPNNGEIDIIEGVNDQVSNQMTLHTSSGCTIANTGFSGTLETTNCDIKAPGQSANSGCVIGDPSTQSYGSGFNAAGGGVYATEWTGSAINMWFWPRSRIPADITRGSPNPAGWGTPVARFAGGCDINSHFKDMQIVCSFFSIYYILLSSLSCRFMAVWLHGNGNADSIRSSTLPSAATGPAPSGLLAPVILKPTPAKPTSPTTRPSSPRRTGASTR